MKKWLSVQMMAKICVLAAIAVIIMLFRIPLWFAPPFYKLDLSETVVLIGGFALGPLAGVIIEFLKILLNLLFNGTDTLGVGELANFAMGISLMLPAALVYKYKHTLKSAIIGMAIGVVSITVVGALINLFIMLPMYSQVYGMPLEAIVEMGGALNSSIVNLNSFVLLAVVPFNLIKGVISSLLAIVIYKRVSPILHKEIKPKKTT